MDKSKALVPMIDADKKIVGMPILRVPELVLKEAETAAKALAGVLNRKKKKVIINNKRYIEFDDWQLLGSFYGVTAKVISTSVIRDEKKKFIGFLAKAVAVKGDVEISGAEAECLLYETNWKWKAFKQRFMLRSMAQTRACAKSLRNCLSWIVVLAGYEATPAEEMTSVKAETIPQMPKPLYKSLLKTLKRRRVKKGKLKRLLKKYDATSVDELDKEDGENLLGRLSRL